MGDGTTLVFRTGGATVGVDRSSVFGVCPWRAPKRLPGGQAWLDGLLLEAGELLAVLREDYLGPADPEAPEVLVLLEEEGRKLAVPGRRAILERDRQPQAGGAPAGDGGSAGAQGADEARGLRIIDPRLLYTSLGLLYNETGSNRGS